MAEKSNSKSHSPNCIDTLIGAGMRIVGDIACTGVLRVQGDILGNVYCQDSSNGTLVVDSAGSVTGTINATHIAVKGRVIGPVQSSQSIEIHRGGSLVGDISFRKIAIHAGGVVDGLLNPTVAVDRSLSAPEQRPRVAEEPAVIESSTPAGRRGLMDRPGGARKTGVAIVLVIAAIAAAWMGRDLAVTTGPAEDVALKTDSSLQDAAEPKKSPPAGSAALPGEPKAADAAPLAPSLSVGAEDTVETPAADSPGMNREKVVTVKGTNPNRPAGVFLLISNEPSVLYRKKRDDPGEGARISTAEGEKVSIAIASDELIRVAQGRDVVILFQGKKVSRNTIESGSWINFVPR